MTESAEITEKIEEFYSHRNLFALISGRWLEGRTDYLETNREEGRFLIALLVLIMVKKIPEKLEPSLVRLFFKNEQCNQEYTILSKKLNELRDESLHEDIRELLHTMNAGKPEYFRTHIGTLVALSQRVIGSLNNFSPDPGGTIPLQINLEDDHSDPDLDFFSITNPDAALLAISGDEPRPVRKIKVSQIPATFAWWQVIEQYLVKLPDNLFYI
jgi:hypothetical protein